jgi:hypothetical protein
MIGASFNVHNPSYILLRIYDRLPLPIEDGM